MSKRLLSGARFTDSLTWLLGIKLGSSEGTVHALNPSAISTAHFFFKL